MVSSRRSASPSEGRQDLSALHAKPCLTCGREITPRAKWARSWDSIKTCSDTCKSQRPGTRRNQIRWESLLNADEITLEAGVSTSRPSAEAEPLHLQILRSESWQSPVQGSLNFQLVKSTTVNAALDNTGEEGKQGLTRVEVIVDLDAWIERTLLQLADSVKPQLRSKQALPTCEDAEDAINADASRISVLLPSRGTDPKRRADPARSTTDQDEEAGAKSLRMQGDAHEHSDSDGIHPLLRACAAKPGLRERVRRAARRLAILDPEHWAVNLAAADASEKVTARLELWNNGKLMHSLADVSHAKGPISFHNAPAR